MHCNQRSHETIFQLFKPHLRLLSFLESQFLQSSLDKCVKQVLLFQEHQFAFAVLFVEEGGSLQVEWLNVFDIPLDDFIRLLSSLSLDVISDLLFKTLIESVSF